MSSIKCVRAVSIVLTTSCNLSCAYCYQNAKNLQRMSWATLGAALGLVLDSPQEEVEILFLGGEPLLEKRLLKRAVAFVRKNRPAGKLVKMGIGTNGLLLDSATSAFLARNDFELRLSFDGIGAAQDFRGSESFPILDRMLDRLRLEQPEYFDRRLTVCVTVVPGGIQHLPASMDYLLRKEISSIILSPGLTSDADWDVARIAELDRLFEQVFSGSLSFWQKKAKVPLRMFQKEGQGKPEESYRRFDCGFLHGWSLTVAPDGGLYGCTILVDSYQDYPNQPLMAQGSTLRIGNIHEPGLAERHAAFLGAARRSEMFHRREEKYSSYGRCRECEFLEECNVCMGSCQYVPGNADPRRISDFACAFSRVSRKYRALFPRQPSLVERIRGTGAMHAEMQRWLDLAKSARRQNDEIRFQ
jgi:uncharacterized protein